VIHARKETGEPDIAKVYGQTAVKMGEHKDVKVRLADPVSPGTRLIAVLYADSGEPGKFEQGVDKPILKPVTNNFRAR
jgi:hypothetical protein